MLPLLDRVHAGRLLASKFRKYAGNPDVVVVGLPRGGMPVAFEIARHLCAPLDILVVKKLGVPWRKELAMGAVASGGVQMLDHALIRSLNLSNYYIYGLIASVEKELQRREALFRNGHPAKVPDDRTVILIDDGAATGSTMLAAAEAVRKQHPKEIIIAVPVASRDAFATFQSEVDECVCLDTPEPFCSVGQWYESFSQVTDAEVQDLLARSRFGKGEAEPLLHSSAASS
jgi:putative phosphoribosyl transferase